MAEVILYLDGVECRLALPEVGSNPEAIAAAAAAQVRAYLAAGFTPTPEATHTAVIDRVVRRQHERDGRKTPVIDMYQSGQQKRFLGVYLNALSDIQAFEGASGLALNDIPLYDGDVPLQMDAAPPDKLNRYVRCPAAPFVVYWRNNPRYTPDSKTAAKRLLVGYAPGERIAAQDGDRASQKNSSHAASPQMTCVPVERVALVKDAAKAWEVLVEAGEWVWRNKAEVVKAWTLPSSMKEELRQKRALPDYYHLEAVIDSAGGLVNVRLPEHEIEF